MARMEKCYSCKLFLYFRKHCKSLFQESSIFMHELKDICDYISATIRPVIIRMGGKSDELSGHSLGC